MFAKSPSPTPSPSLSPSPSPTPSPSPSAIITAEDPLTWVFSDAPIRLFAIVVTAAIINWVLAWLIKRVVRRSINSPGLLKRAGAQAQAQQERREQRAKAIGQLTTSIVTLIVWGTAVLMILPLLGVNITPLLASASVIGVALGFGAQTLIKDYLSGIFLILEDQFGVGDFVDLGEAVGTVDEVTLRVTRLRDTSGVVWYVRNGEILRVANRSQGWTMAIIDIPVAYDQDLDDVQTVVEQTADAMVADPDSLVSEFSRPTYAGVESVSGEAVFVRVLAKSDPGDQIPLQREIRQRLKASFDEAGIRVPVLYRMPGAPGAPGAPGGSGGPGAGAGAGSGSTKQ